jgi:Cu/Ag efflux pump CusA
MIVEVNPVLLQQYHVAVNDVILALKSKNINFPGGIGPSDNEERLIPHHRRG